MPFDNDVSGSEMASLVALQRLIAIDRGMVSRSRAIAGFVDGRGRRLARTIIDKSAPENADDAAALAMIERVAVVGPR